MGLDQYARSTSRRLNSQVDFPTDEADIDLHYWRKHPDLHGWMEMKYRDKGGQQDFNCVPVVLTAEDLDELETAITQRFLPPTTGFFFGRSELSDEEIGDDLCFLRKARVAIKAGRTVYYSSWW
jgi:hypothetical protein